MAQYEGGCHCGAVRFAVEADLSKTITCNCSHCAMKGVILAFAPAEAFTLHSGEDHLTEYLFNRKAIHHQFCKTCGVEPFARGEKPDGTSTVAINVRCLSGVALDDLAPVAVDGRSF
jgi:hypothetical protein